MWKPGQIVTLCGKRYRITKDVDFDCRGCDNYNIPSRHEPCYTCLWGEKMPFGCHLKEIKPER